MGIFQFFNFLNMVYFIKHVYKTSNHRKGTRKKQEKTVILLNIFGALAAIKFP